MFKYLFILFSFLTFLNASYLKEAEILYAKDKNQKIEDIINSKEFKRAKLPLVRIDKRDVFLKIKLKKEMFEEEEYVLEFKSMFNDLKFSKDLNISDIYSFKIAYLNKTQMPEYIYVKAINDDGYISLKLNLYKKDEFKSLKLLENRLYGISNGIIIAAVLYYLALFFFNRQKSYVYYSLTQVSMLLILVFISGKELQAEKYVFDGIFMAFFVFSSLFTKSFLNTKVNAPRLDKMITLVVGLFFIDLFLRYAFSNHAMSENIPFSFFLSIYIFTAFVVYFKGYKPALFYLLGWSLVIGSFLFIEIQVYFFEKEFLIEPTYLLNIVSPLETLVLAFALSYKMKYLEDEKQEQQEFLTHQSKLASMGEMIGNIAHQWRQPLTHLSYIMMNLKTAYEKDRLSKEYFDKKSKEANIQLEFMSNTIDDFRDFFKVNKNKEEFCVNEAIDEVRNILGASLKAHDIKITFQANAEYKITSYKGEFLQVIFNLINNAKDEFIKNPRENALINITLKKCCKKVKIQVCDNAGGIKKEILEKVFEPYFTTKDKGLGIGLYMSKMIVEKNMNGTLEVKNEKDGACFKILV